MKIIVRNGILWSLSGGLVLFDALLTSWSNTFLWKASIIAFVAKMPLCGIHWQNLKKIFYFCHLLYLFWIKKIYLHMYNGCRYIVKVQYVSTYCPLFSLSSSVTVGGKPIQKLTWSTMSHPLGYLKIILNLE